MRALAALSRFVGNTFAYWVLIFAVLAFFEPNWFIGLKSAIVPLLGLVMFGMGLTLKLEDFAEVARHPWRVALGVVAHFVIMPGVAWLLCQAFQLPPEIAVGVINGAANGFITGVVCWLIYGNYFLGIIVFMAMIGNLVVAGIFGFLVPVLLKACHQDPALGSSVLLTTATDTLGFFIFLGLATIFLPYLK